METAFLNLIEATTRCVADSRLTNHGLAVSVAFDPVVPLGFRRFRFVIFTTTSNFSSIETGPIARCRLRVREAPPGPSSPLKLERVLPLNNVGAILDVLTVSDVLTVDSGAPSQTPTHTATATPSETNTSTPTNTATATATPTNTAIPTPTPTVTPTATSTSTRSHTATPSPTRTNTRIPCNGDCDGDGQVTVAELIRIVRIGLDLQPVSDCPAADRNDDGAVAIAELIAAVNRALNGCTPDT